MSRNNGPYTSVKLRNDLLRLDPSLNVQVKPVRVNGAVFGCSGFVINPPNGAIVYVSTDHNHGQMYNKALYRTAKSTRDYSGGTNNTCAYADLAQNVVNLLRKGAAGEKMPPRHNTPSLTSFEKPVYGATGAGNSRAQRALSDAAADRQVSLTLYKVRHLRKTPNGNSVFELTTDKGTLSTTSNSHAGVVLSPREYPKGVRANVVITPRGTVRDIKLSR